MAIGYKSDDDVSSESEELLDNLAFMCYDERGSNAKYEYYKEQLIKEYSNDEVEIVEPVEKMIPGGVPPTIASGPMDSAWPMKCHDTHHTSQSPYSTAHITEFEKWRFCGIRPGWGGVEGSPIIGDDGTIYYGDKDRNVYALYPNGTLKWSYLTDMWITSAPALAEDGTLYVGSWDHYLYAFNSITGTLKWRFNAKGTIASSPAIADDGTIYFGTMWDDATGHRIWAVNPNGTEKWQYKTGHDIVFAPAIGDDGTIYIGSGDTYFYAMNPNGTLKWRFKTGDIIKGSASITDDGTVYIGSFDDYLYALYPNNGTMKWKSKVGYGTESNPSIASDGTIYTGGEKLYAIYPNGTMRWSFNLGTDRFIFKSCPAISADGTIFVGVIRGRPGYSSGGELLAVNPDGTEKWRSKKLSSDYARSSPCIGEDGTVYIGTQGLYGYIHAFGPVESNSPPETPTISGEKMGQIGEEYWYRFIADDSDNNPISFYIDWGDGNEGWVSERAPREHCWYEHTWSEQGDYTIRAKAKDVLDEESDWAYLEVSMPVNQQTAHPWFHWFLERFPNMFPILRNLI